MNSYCWLSEGSKSYIAMRLHILQPSQSYKWIYNIPILDTCTEDVYNYTTIPAVVETISMVRSLLYNF